MDLIARGIRDSAIECSRAAGEQCKYQDTGHANSSAPEKIPLTLIFITERKALS